jgi:hypothetical protein
VNSRLLDEFGKVGVGGWHVGALDLDMMAFGELMVELLFALLVLL